MKLCGGKLAFVIIRRSIVQNGSAQLAQGFFVRLVRFFHGGLGAVAESDLFRHDDVQNHFQRAALVRFGKNWQTLAELFVRALPLLVRGAHFLAGDGDGGAIDILHREFKSQ